MASPMPTTVPASAPATEPTRLSTHERQWRAGRFWWDGTSTASAMGPTATHPLQAIVFDLDALADVECDAHRVAFNAAFAAHGLDVSWSVARYRQLLALSDERQRVTAELRRRGISSESDVLTALLADEICATKTMIFDEVVVEADLTPRPGLIDLINDAFVAGVSVGVITSGQRGWADSLVRQLVGDGMVQSVVTADDVARTVPDPEAFGLALHALGAHPDTTLTVTGSAAGLRAATALGLPTVVITGDGTPDIPAAVAVRSDYQSDRDGGAPLGIAECQRLHSDWWTAHNPSAA